MTNAKAAQEKNLEFDLQRLASVCLLKWRTIAASAAAAMVLAFIYSVAAPPSYRATAKLLIDPRQQKIMAAEEVLPGLSSDVSAIETQVELLMSARVAQRVINEMNAGRPSDPVTDLQVQRFLSNLTVARKGLTYVVDVSYTASDPEKAAEIANRAARAYIAGEAESIGNITGRANAWLKERIKTAGPELMSLEKAILEFRAATGFFTIGEQTVAERNIVDYVAQLSLARAAMAEAEAKLELDRSKSAMQLQSQDAFDVAKIKVTLMERGLRSLTDGLINHRLQAIREQDLEREAVAARSLYDALLKRQRETEVQQNLAIVNARLAQEALPPAYPAWPRRGLLLIAGAFLGAVIGVFIAAGGEIFPHPARERGQQAPAYGYRGG